MRIAFNKYLAKYFLDIYAFSLSGSAFSSLQLMLRVSFCDTISVRRPLIGPGYLFIYVFVLTNRQTVRQTDRFINPFELKSSWRNNSVFPTPWLNHASKNPSEQRKSLNREHQLRIPWYCCIFFQYIIHNINVFTMV